MLAIGRLPRRTLRSLTAALLIGGAVLAPGELRASPRDHVLQWIPPDGAVVGYRVHLGRGTDFYDEIVDLGAVPIDPDGVGRATLTLESTRDYFVAMSAYNAAGESPLSNEVVVPASTCDPLACDDGEECTADDCAADGCTHSPLPDGTLCAPRVGGFGTCFSGACEAVECTEASHCDDGDACNGIETCDASGACMAGAPLRCGAPTQCSVPGCDAELGCIEIPLPDGTPCEDGRRSTLGDSCRAGVCEGGQKRGGGHGPK